MSKTSTVLARLGLAAVLLAGTAALAPAVHAGAGPGPGIHLAHGAPHPYWAPGVGAHRQRPVPFAGLMAGVRSGRVACYRQSFGHPFAHRFSHPSNHRFRHHRIGPHALARLMRGGFGDSVRCYRVH